MSFIELANPPGVSEDHDRVVVLLVRPLDLVDGVAGGDRIDVVVELDREN